MLYSIVVGGHIKRFKNRWSIKSDYYKNNYVVSTFGQKIKLPKFRDLTIRPSKLDYGVVSSIKFSLPDNVMIVNNNVTLGLTLMNYAVSKGHKGHVDDDLVFITINSSKFRVFGYSVGKHSPIVSTYRKPLEYSGCGMQLKVPKGLPEDKDVELLSVDVYNYETETAERFHVIYRDNDVIVTFDKPGVNKMDKPDSELYFKFTTNDELVTSYYITKESLLDEVKEAVSKEITNPVFYTIPDDVFIDAKLSAEDYKKVIHTYFLDIVKSKRVRAVTTVGVYLTPRFARESKLSYLFSMEKIDSENPGKGIKCVKSC